MRKEQGKQSITHLATLLLLGVFAVFILVVLVQGVGAYNRLNERDGRAFEKRTGIQYLSTKVHQAKSGKQIELVEFGPEEDVVTSLVITEEIEGEFYQSYIYYYDGWLRELFVAEGGASHPEDGERILEAQELKLWIEKDLLWMVFTDSAGERENMAFHLRGRDGL